MGGLKPREVARIAGQIVEETRPLVKLDVAVGRAEYRGRWKAVQRAMKERGYGLAYACGSELDRSDAAWLAGIFDPIIERYGILVPSEGIPVVLAGSEGGHVIESSVEVSGSDVAILAEFQISDEDYRHAHFVKMADVIRRLGLKPGSVRVAVMSSAQFIPQEHVVILQAAFGSDNVLFDCDFLRRIKYEKSPTELRIMEQANIIADAAFRGMLAVTVPGMRELEVAAVADYIMKALGAGRTGFPTIVTAGERQYSVIGPATNNVIREGDTVSLGLSPTFNGYHGIIRRTVRAGRPMSVNGRSLQKAVEDLYTVVMDATREAARKNKPANRIDERGKKFLSNLRLKTIGGRTITPLEPYTFIHNTGCSECQEGMGAVTPYTDDPLGKNVALMIDVALLGFVERGKPLFDVLYAVVEDAFWKAGAKVGVYNRFPLNVQHLVGNTDPIGENVNPYHVALAVK